MRILFLACVASTVLWCTPVLQAQCEPGLDCNGNGQLDECDIVNGLSADCDANGIPDECDIAANPPSDCNQNGLLDACEPIGSVLLTGVLNGEVAMSGNTMLICEATPILEPGEVADGEPAPPRRVDVYERVGSTWLLSGQLNPGNSLTEDNFGMSIAIDGDLAAVGAPGSDGSEGSVYLFARTGQSWTQVDLLTSESPATDDAYGTSVSVLGTDVIVGAPQTLEVEPVDAAPGGFAEMWTQDGTSWTRTGHVSVTQPFAGGGEENGASVALGAGGWAFVGAPSANAGSGRVHMYLQVGGSWLLVGSLLASDAGQNTLLGTQMETDGTTLVVTSAKSPNVNGPIGAIYTFERTATTWTQVDKTVSPLNALNTNGYGASLALTGEFLAVGEPNIDNQQGSTHLYKRDGTGWQLRESIRPASILDGDRFGASVASNGDWTASIASGIPSSFITHTELSEDCDSNGVDDRCDIASGTHADCNGNEIPDDCDISSGIAQDCDGDLIPDSCNLIAGVPDCNQNNVPDSCDISSGTSTDCNGDTIADDCQTDCDGNGIPDDCDLLAGVPDCNGNTIPDSCDLLFGFALDCDGNQIPDSCDLADGAPDCDGDSIQDSCAIAAGATDCDLDGTPDDCEIANAPSLDCNGNAELDSCDVDSGLSPDCDGNQIPDECQLAAGTSEDCNTNGIPDACEQPNLVDDTPPQIVGTPGNMTGSADLGSCSTDMLWISPAATDNCGPPPLVTSSHTSGSQFQVGSHTVTFSATDQYGNSALTSFTVLITDDENPALNGTPPSKTQTAQAGACSASVMWLPPSSTDNCPATVVTSSRNPGDVFQVGTETVTYTATDASGNAVSTSFDVTVTDDEAPAYSAAPQSQDLSSDPGSCGAVATWAAHGIDDNCGIATDTSSAASGDFFGLGPSTVTMTLTDIHGNPTTHQFTITVTDTEAPQLHDMPTSMTQTAEAGSCGATMSWAAPTTTDNCPNPALSSSHQPGDNFPVGTTTVTYTSDDANGLSTSASFDITITDDELPVFDTAPGNMPLDTDPGSCETIVTWAEPLTSDNCGANPLLSGSHMSGSSFPIGETTVTYTVEDQHGNTAQSSFVITISDNEVPTLSGVPTSFTVTNDPDLCGATVSWIEPTAADNCGIAGTSSDVTSGSNLPVGDTLVTYATTDANGNLTTAAFTVTVLDDQNPQFTSAPASVSQGTDRGACGAVISWAAPSIFENCTTQTLISSHQSGAFFEKGTTEVVMTSTDSSGNSATHTFLVTIEDTEDPTISGTPIDIQSTADQGSCGALISWTPPTAADNCPGEVLTSTHNSGDFFAVGTSSVSYTATDSSGRSISTSFTVTVTDDEAPAYSAAPQSQDLSSDLGSCGAVATWAAHSSSDNCGIATDTSSAASGDSFGLGTSTVTMTLTDIHGNSTPHQFTITVTDTEAPQLHDMPTSMTQTAEAGSCGATMSWAAPTTTDNCPNPALSSTHQPGDNFPVGTTTVTYTSDDANGLSTSASFDITITDDEAPAYSGAPASQDLPSDPGSCGAVASWAAHSTSDNCGIESDTSSAASGDFFGLGPSTVTMTLTDIHGNSTIHQFTITVTDTEAPTLTGMPATMSQTNDPDQCGAIAEWSEPTSADNCAGESTSSTHSSGGFYEVGTTTVTYTVADASGNSTDYSFDVTVTDDQAPAFDQAPADMTISSLPGECQANATWATVLSSDNCASPTLTSSASSGDIFPVGMTMVSMSLLDIHGNSSSHSFTVTVADDEFPQFADMPSDMVLSTDPGQCGAIASWTAATASDNCGLGAYVTSHLPGDTFEVGTTTVTYTQADINGNLVSGTMLVTVNDNEAPTITTSGDITEPAPAGTCVASLTIPTPAITDNCTVINLTNNLNGTDNASGSYDHGTTIIVWTGTDNHGNSSEVTQAVTVSVPQADCNGNGSPDVCDLASGLSADCDGNSVPDECDVDCNQNGSPDACDIAAGLSIDCNGNGVPDVCDLASQDSSDANANSIPDECDPAFKRGDANDDANVDIADAIYMLYSLMLGGPASSCIDATDANDDGTHDISDIIYVLNYQFQNGAPPPAPGPSQCGIDMTPDDGLDCNSYGGCP